MAVRSAKREPVTRKLRTRTPRTPREGPTVSVRKQSVSDVIARSLEEDIVLGRRHPREHSAAIDAGDLLTVFYSNLHFHQMLFGLCSNTCLIEAIELLAQKTYGIRSYANAFPEALDQARRDHIEMIEALRASRRDDLIALARRHLKPSQVAYIRAYERRFGDSNRAAM